MHDLISNLGLDLALAPQTIDSDPLDSGDIDTQGAEALAVALLVGDMEDTLGEGVRIDVKIEHADDDGSGAPGAYAACTDADVIYPGSLGEDGVFVSIDSAGKAQKRHVIGYRGGKRFVRVTATPAGLEDGGPIALLAIRGNAARLPPDNA